MNPPFSRSLLLASARRCVTEEDHFDRACCRARALSLIPLSEVYLAKIANCIIAVAVFLACASPLTAQTFIEAGGGWNYVPLLPSTTGDALKPHGLNLRAAIGRTITPRVRLRVDAFTLQFNDKIPVNFYLRCTFPICSTAAHEAAYEGNVSGMAVNALVNMDRRGLFYLVGGAGLFFDADAVFKFDVPLKSELRLGVTAGAGFTVPLGARLRGFAEARWNGPFGSQNLAPWIVPVTLGLRYGR